MNPKDPIHFFDPIAKSAGIATPIFFRQNRLAGHTEIEWSEELHVQNGKYVPLLNRRSKRTISVQFETHSSASYAIYASSCRRWCAISERQFSRVVAKFENQ